MAKLTCQPCLLEFRGTTFLLRSSNQEADFGEYEGQLQLVVLKHDEHVLNFLLVDPICPVKTPAIVAPVL